MRIAAVALALLAAAVSSARAADVTFDDTARFLAGMQPSPDSPLVPLTKDPGWQRHAKFFDGAFAQLEQRQLSKIRNWADVNLAAPRPTMFYLFSGPDFLYADAFYSKASTYVLGALEPVGAVPDLTRLPRGSVGAALYNVERSLGSILSFSFFITKHMKVDLHANQVNGTLPILYVFLARSGKTIRNVEMIALDDKGGVHTGGDNPGRNATRGVRITFAGSDGEARTLYYFLDRSLQCQRAQHGISEILRDARARQQPAQERVLSPAQGRLLRRSQLAAGQQRDHHPGRFRHSACELQCATVAVLPVRPLSRTDRRIPRPLPGALRRTVHARPADRFRRRLSLADA
ncbi:hypothetical protein ACVW0J_004932 [Bradyrhizobium sp. i1.7.7]